MNNHYKKLMRKAFHLILGAIGFFLFVTLLYVIAVSGKKPVKAGVDIVKGIEEQNVPALLQAIRQKDVTEIDVTVPTTEVPIYSVPEKTTEEATTLAPEPPVTEIDVTEPADEALTQEPVVQPTDPPTDPPTQAPTDPIETDPPLTVKQIKIQDFQAEWNEKLDQNDVRNLSNEEQQQIHAMFMNTIFFGDSMTQAIGDYGFIDMSQVIYKRSASVDALIEKIPEVAAVYPERVIIFVGLNNCNFYKTPEDFATAFTALVQKLREQIPGVTLCVSSLLPPSDVLGSTRADLVRAPMYDALLNHTANMLGVEYIDAKWIVRQQNYLKDGIHMNRTFYRVWFRYLQLLMGPNL
ncbi:MAG: hypothetical protein IKS10_11685 [Lachnospiraceae bacterium]|nr:hypothetical protein [Lachnospiraceae bacterium]